MIELVGVFVNVFLSNFLVAIHDVVDEYLSFDSDDTFIGIFKFGIVYRFDGFGYLVDANTYDVFVGMIVVLAVVIFGAQAFVFMYLCACWNVGVGWRQGYWWDVGSTVLDSKCC